VRFLLDQINFEDDYARTEDEKMSRQIHDELRSVYNDLGHEIVEVPVIPVDRRADLIERKINRTPIH